MRCYFLPDNACIPFGPTFGQRLPILAYLSAGMGVQHSSASAGVTVLSATRTDQGQNGTVWCDPAIGDHAFQLRKLASLDPSMADLTSDFNSFPQLRRKLREITLEGVEVGTGTLKSP